MDTNNQEFTEGPVLSSDPESTEETDEMPVPRKRRKKKKGWIIVLVVLILAAGASGSYYFMQRQKPVSTVKNYLADVKAMDFDGMKSLLQSSDMSALDNADITSDAYSSFFKTINQKMSYKITKTKFNITTGTATVTAHIKYIDGSDIYKETITEFLKQIVSTAFSGSSLSEDETQQKLASLLEEKSGTVDDKFSETDINYPLIEAGGKWKIVSLDSETVRIMSANFVNVQDEITQSLSDMENQTEGAATTPAPSDNSDGTIDMTNEKFTLHYTQCRITKDLSGDSCLLVYYDYTNNGSSPSSAMVDLNLQAYQNGEALQAAIPENDEAAIDQYMAEINPGQTVNVCQAFSLNDTSDVTLQAGEAFSFGGGNVKTQILKVQ